MEERKTAMDPKMQAITKAAHQAAAAKRKPFKGIFARDCEYIYHYYLICCSKTHALCLWVCMNF
jgi:hypothetical protein